MRPRARAAISFLFILLFVVTTPIVILYTSGYAFNWKRQRVQKTGSIRVETIPAAAEVLLDGVAQKKVTPTSYDRLLPEDYDVQILERGYIPWEKTLPVKSGETTFAIGVTLYKDVLPRLLLETKIDTAAWSPDQKTIAYVTDDGKWQEVATLVSGKPRTLLARFPHATYADAQVVWSPNSDSFLFTATSGGATRILKFSADGVSPTIAVHDRFAKGTLRAHWSPDGSAVIVMNADGASSVDAATGAVSPLRLAPDLLDADIRGRNVYTLRTVRDVNAQGVVIERGTGANATAVAELSPGDYRFAVGTDRFLVVTETRRGKLTLVDLNDNSVNAYDATDISWDVKGTRALVWNDFEISLVNAADGSETLITRLGAAISGCQWAPSGDAVVYGTPNAISIAEFDDRDRRVVTELLRFSDVGAFAVDAKAKVLRFVGSIGNQHGVYERDL